MVEGCSHMYLEVNTWLYIEFRQLNYQEGAEMFRVAFCHFIWSFQVKYNVFFFASSSVCKWQRPSTGLPPNTYTTWNKCTCHQAYTTVVVKL